MDQLPEEIRALLGDIKQVTFSTQGDTSDVGIFVCARDTYVVKRSYDVYEAPSRSAMIAYTQILAFIAYYNRMSNGAFHWAYKGPSSDTDSHEW